MLACVAFSSAVSAQPARQYGVMSLLADTLTIVGQEPQTGTMLKKNTEDSMPLADDSLDRFAALATLRALAKAAPGAKAVAVRGNSPVLYKLQLALDDGSIASLPSETVAALRDAGITHLLLLTKRRDDARMQAHDQSFGSGKVQGLGFYVDRYKRVQRAGTSDQSVGFLAPYAYFDVTLIEVETQKVIRSARVTNSFVVAAAATGTSGADPWDVLDARKKMESLGQLLTEGIEASVPKLFATH